MAAAAKTRVKKKTLTLAQAADQFEKARREIAKFKLQEEEAGAVLKAHFSKTGRNSYKDRIGFSVTSRLVLEQRKVREYLGDRIGDFQKRIKVESLSLLK